MGGSSEFVVLVVEDHPTWRKVLCDFYVEKLKTSEKKRKTKVMSVDSALKARDLLRNPKNADKFNILSLDLNLGDSDAKLEYKNQKLSKPVKGYDSHALLMEVASSHFSQQSLAIIIVSACESDPSLPGHWGREEMVTEEELRKLLENLEDGYLIQKKLAAAPRPRNYAGDKIEVVGDAEYAATSISKISNALTSGSLGSEVEDAFFIRRANKDWVIDATLKELSKKIEDHNALVNLSNAALMAHQKRNRHREFFLVYVIQDGVFGQSSKEMPIDLTDQIKGNRSTGIPGNEGDNSSLFCAASRHPIGKLILALRDINEPPKAFRKFQETIGSDIVDLLILMRTAEKPDEWDSNYQFSKSMHNERCWELIEWLAFGETYKKTAEYDCRHTDWDESISYGNFKTLQTRLNQLISSYIPTPKQFQKVGESVRETEEKYVIHTSRTSGRRRWNQSAGDLRIAICSHHWAYTHGWCDE